MGFDRVDGIGDHLRIPFDVGIAHTADLMPGEYLRNCLGSAAQAPVPALRVIIALPHRNYRLHAAHA